MWSISKKLRSLGISKGAEYEGVCEYRLDANGLRILLVENHSAPVFVHLLLFGVGGCNEETGQAGFAHFLEHLKYKGNDFDNILNAFGADNNASTGHDFTDFHVISPIEHLETVIKLEAARVRNLPFTDTDHASEVKVVLDEIAKYKKDPDDVLQDKLMAKAFRVHPYRLPILGTAKDLKGSKAQDLKDFNDKFYWPNNATVILVGDFETLAVLEMIKRHYGVLPPFAGTLPTVDVVEPAQEAERRFEVKWKDEVEPRVMIGYHIPEATHQDMAAITMLAYVLGSEEKPDSILYRALVDTEKASAANAVNQENIHPGMFLLTATCEGSASAHEVESILLDCMERLKTEPVSEELLNTIKLFVRKDCEIKRDDFKSFAEFLAESISTSGHWQWRLHNPKQVDAVTAQDVMRVCRTYFTRENRTVGHLVASNTVQAAPGDTAPGSTAPSLNHKPATETESAKSAPLVQTADSSGSGRLSFSDRVKKIVLDNGLTVVAMSTPGTGTASISGFTRAGEMHTPAGKAYLPELVALSFEGGTDKLSKDEVSRRCHEMNALLDFKIGSTRTRFSATVVRDDLGDYLSLLGEIITNPSFKARDLKIAKANVKSAVKECLVSTDEMSMMELNQALHQPGSIHRWTTFNQALKELPSITREDLADFHRQFWSPHGTVLAIVGDFDSDKVLELIPDTFKKWKGPQVVHFAVPDVVLPAEARRIDVKMTPEERPDIMIGLPVNLDRNSKDIIDALIANSHLGGDTMMGRLGKVVRVTHGLTYGITSRFSNLFARGGTWDIRFATKAEDVDKALKLIDEVWHEFFEKGLSQEQLDREKSNMLGRFAIGMCSTLGIANVLANNEYCQRCNKWLDRQKDRFDAVTVDSVNTAIKNHFDLSRAVTVVAGL